MKNYNMILIREAAKILALSSGKVDKYGQLKKGDKTLKQVEEEQKSLDQN